MPKTTSGSKKLKTAIGVVVDESGSMGSRAEETRIAFNKYFDDIEKEDPTVVVTAANFSLLTADKDKVRYLCKNTPVSDMPYLDEENYSPNGSTPLLDAVGHVINTLSREKADRYLVVILTDGFENASVEYSKSAITSLIQQKEATDKWTFVYLGAGKEAWGGAVFLGISTPGTIVDYSGTPGTTSQTVNTITASTRSYLASTKTSDPDFIDTSKKTVKS